jgi:fructose-bisphosphate aldolase class I
MACCALWISQKAIATTGKGILAADESTGTIGKRFAPISVENNEENRRRYRELLFTTEGELQWRPNKMIGGSMLHRPTFFVRKLLDSGQFVAIYASDFNPRCQFGHFQP